VIYKLLYIDPGSGSYAIQVIIAAVLGVVFWIRTLWQRFRFQHGVVFYAESRHYYQYFEKLINDLLKENVKVFYITSDAADPLLKNAPQGMQVMHVKWMLGLLFKKIKADVVVMTMPDLGNYLYKRSAAVKKNIYMFHAAVSTHQQYRKEAFFNYDAVFCTGEYQLKELRKAEELYSKNQKELIAYGYPLLDTIKEQAHPDARQVVLVAPSWFDGCIFDTCIDELLLQLSKLPYEVVLRCHPEYRKRKSKTFTRIIEMTEKYPNMMIDEEPDVIKTLSVADILITDRSGIAFEFAFGTAKPVLFIETPLKQTNPFCNELGIEPIENKLRSELGISVSPDNLEQLPQRLDELTKFADGFDSRMESLKKNLFYNTEESYKQGVEYIKKHISN
jgi:YidC/Oxa1 family membrane protein insertase